jgi:hypothetical protein
MRLARLGVNPCEPDDVGPEFREQASKCGVVAEIDDVEGDPFAGQFLPSFDAAPQRRDRDQAVHSVFQVEATAGQVVDHPHVVTARRQMERLRPAEIAISAEQQNPHVSPPPVTADYSLRW